MELFLGTLNGIIGTSGFALMDVKSAIMIALSCLLLYLGIVKKFEPLLLVGIAFGMLLTNLPGSGVYNPDYWFGEVINYGEILRHGGLLDITYIGVKTGLYPSLIFMGVGAMTDFGPLIARPSSLFMGAAAQGGIFVALLMATLLGFAPNVAASIAIIGGADGPTAIWLTKILAPEYLGPIAIAAYSYMALIPLIQPPCYEAADHRQGAQDQDGHSASRVQDREDHLPHHGRYRLHPGPALHRSSAGLPAAG